MKLRCEPKLDLAKEAALLLGHFCCAEEDQDENILNSVQSKHPQRLISQQEKETLLGLDNLRREIKRLLALTPRQSELFRANCCMEAEYGESCAVLYPFYRANGMTAAQVWQQVGSLSEGRLRRAFLDFFLDWHEKGDQSLPDEIGLETLVQVLDAETDLNERDKWSIIGTFANFHAAFGEAMECVLRLTGILAGMEESIHTYIQRWAEWVNAELQAGENGRLLSKVLQIVPGLKNVQQEIVVRPSLSMLIGIGIRLESGTPLPVGSTESELRIGLAVPGFCDLLFDKMQIGETELLSALKLLSEKSKFDILMTLSKQAAYGAQIAQQMGLSPATISHHLGALLNEGLVMVQVKENRAYYTPNTPRIHALLACMAGLFPAS